MKHFYHSFKTYSFVEPIIKRKRTVIENVFVFFPFLTKKNWSKHKFLRTLSQCKKKTKRVTSETNTLNRNFVEMLNGKECLSFFYDRTIKTFVQQKENNEK